MKMYTIKITERESLYVDIAAETYDEAIEKATSEYEDGVYDQMRRECDGAEFEITDIT